MLNSFKGVNNNIINPKKLNIKNQTSKKNLNSKASKKSQINPVLRPRRKLQLGLKLPNLKDLAAPKSTTVDIDLEENNSSTNLDTQTSSTTVSLNANSEASKATTKATAANKTEDLTTLTTLKQTTTFIPTPTPPKKVGKFPFSFKGPLKPKLLSFSIDKYKSNKKKNKKNKFSTKVNDS